jgi:hypothetical protein
MYCYRFNSRNQFRTLAAAEGLVVNNELITASHTYSLDEIGIISKGGEWDAQTGEMITPPTNLSGWHVNSQGLAPEAWDQYLIVVNSASRTWFGGATQAPDDATLEAMQ